MGSLIPLFQAFDIADANNISGLRSFIDQSRPVHVAQTTPGALADRADPHIAVEDVPLIVAEVGIAAAGQLGHGWYFRRLPPSLQNQKGFA
jgi:hypothetical protein